MKLEKEELMKGLDVYDFEKAQDKENLMADIKAGKTLAGLQRQAFRDQQNQACNGFNIYVHFNVCLHQIRISFQMISAQECGMLRVCYRVDYISIFIFSRDS